MKCCRLGCTWSSENILLLELHEKKCPRIHVSRSIVKTRTPARLGGNASHVPSDNLERIPVVEGRKDSPMEIGSANVSNDSSAFPTAGKQQKIERMGVLLEEVGRRTSRRLAEDIIHLLNDKFPIESFAERCQSYKDCHALTNSLVSSRFENLKFKRKVIRMGNKECEYFVRCPLKLLKAQITTAAYEDILKDGSVDTNINGVKCVSNPFSGEMGHEGIPAIREAIENSTNSQVFWRPSSFVRLGQLYSDKSATSLKPDAFTFYPLHLTLFNFPENIRRFLIVHGMTTVAYLPVSFLSISTDGIAHTERSERLRILHRTIAEILSSLSIVAEEGFPCESRDGVQFHRHFAVANYVADIPEAKDVLGILHGNRTKRPCHRCLCERDDLSAYRQHKWRTLEETKLIRLDNRNTTKLAENSMSSQVGFLEDFPFVGISKTMDMYQIFSFEPLHALYIGISKLLKFLVYERLGDKSKRSQKLGNKLFSTIRSQVLSAANRMIQFIHKECYAPGLHLNLVSKQKGKTFNGLFGEKGLRGFLEAKHFKGLDRIFPFVAAFIDRCCGEVDEAPTTKVAVLFTELVMLAERRGMEAGWTELDLVRLEQVVREFKSCASSLYIPYQKSRMNTMNFHLLDHLTSDIRRNGGIQYGDSCLFEHSHVMVKERYRETSKRRETAMKETLEAFHRSLLNKVGCIEPGTRKYKGARHNAHEKDSAAFVRDGKRISVNDFKLAREYARNQRKGGSMLQPENLDALQLVEDISEDGAGTLIRLLKERYGNDSSLIMTRVASAFVTGGYIPSSYDTFKDRKGEVQIKFVQKRRKLSQRLVSCRSFHARKGLRQDCVMIEQDKQEGNRSVWIAKVLALLKVSNEEMVFVQYFDAVEDLDNCTVNLKCVNRKWSRNESSGDEKGLGKYFGLVNVDTLRGVVHVVRGDFGSTKTLEERSWPSQFFHVNRFYTDTNDIEY